MAITPIMEVAEATPVTGSTGAKPGMVITV
jgi:hypothetical protein